MSTSSALDGTTTMGVTPLAAKGAAAAHKTEVLVGRASLGGSTQTAVGSPA